MTIDFSAVPRLADGRTGAEHIALIEALSERRRTAMGNGGRMMWHIWGAGSGRPALLLFHGGSGSWIHWIRNVIPLSRHFTVYAADMPGLGDSDPPDDVRDIWSVVHGVKRGVEAIVPAGERYAIAGFSFGGMVGGHVSTLLDERLRSVTLVGPGGLRLPREPRPPLVRLSRERTAEGLAQGARRNLEILMLHDPANVDGVAIHMQILNSTRAKTRSADMSAQGVLSDCLPKITTRLNAIWGEFDSTAYPHLAMREALLRRHQPDIDFRVIPGGGHWVAFEKADEVNAALIDLLG
ncbi:MAG: alpha/beta hydrolase [Alphaproteobacteria bacterium]|nr:alpha/beta hydrolase [Alphaproteobacteria bacterium]